MSIHNNVNFTILFFIFSFLYCYSQNPDSLYKVKPIKGSVIEPIGDMNKDIIKKYKDSTILYLNRGELYSPLKEACIDYEVNYMSALDGLTEEFLSFRHELFNSFDDALLKKLQKKFDEVDTKLCQNTYNIKMNFSEKSNSELIGIILSTRSTRRLENE